MEEPDRQTNHSAGAWLARPLARLTAWLLRSPGSVLLISALVAIAAISIAITQLGFRGSRLDLLDPHSSYNRRWLSYLDEFGDDDDVVVVIEGTSPARVIRVIDEMGQALQREPDAFRAVLFSNDLSTLRGKALHFLSAEQLSDVERLCRLAEPMVRQQWAALTAEGIASRAQGLAASRPDRHAAASPEVVWMRQYLTGLMAALVGETRDGSPTVHAAKMLGELAGRFEPQHLVYDEGRLGLIMLRLARDANRFRGPPVARLQSVVSAMRQRYPDVSIGLTGMPILESDEMKASQTDTGNASIVSLAGVACVFVAGFGGLRRPLFSLAALIMALAWSMGYITLSVGHLNILSASFGVILIGLGVDFSIHYIAQYANCLHELGDRVPALVATARAVGPGILTGGVTTSLAFSTAALTRFMGIAELGVIVAGGILLCILSALIVLPALIAIWDRPHGLQREPLDVAGKLHGLRKHSAAVLICAALVCCLVGAGVQQLRYDHNLLNLQPATLESVALERTLARRLNRGVWHALSVAASRQQLLERKEQFEKLPMVSRTEEIVSLLPAISKTQKGLITTIHRSLQELPDRVPPLPVGRREELLPAIEQVSSMVSLPGAEPNLALPAIAQLSPEVFYARLSQYQQRVVEDLRKVLQIISSMSSPVSPHLADLPESVRVRFVGKNGFHLLRVYGHGDIWDFDPLERFVKGVETIDGAVTGHPIQTYYASREMQQSFLHAAIYSLLAVSIVLMLDFRKIRFCLMAMLPMALGMVLMFGALGWLGIALNPANLIVLPLILGIGIDDGVHVVHDFLRQRRGTYQLSNATASAVVLTSLTTMIGFGSMMLASHRGLRSLGQVLTIGIFCCLVTSLLVLPPLLAWIGGAFSKDE